MQANLELIKKYESKKWTNVKSARDCETKIKNKKGNIGMQLKRNEKRV